jgi:hypothetical protein
MLYAKGKHHGSQSVFNSGAERFESHWFLKKPLDGGFVVYETFVTSEEA